ncbi:MAG: hypothetical protein SFU84_05330 [Gemmatimonadales bacterium]|nr:hypothetical protein [Gemmatimonadales bacterium]
MAAFLALSEGGTAITGTAKTLTAFPSSALELRRGVRRDDVKALLDANPSEPWACERIADENLEA